MTTLPLAAACDDRRAGIVALLDGELDTDAADTVRAHITACAACGAFYAETSELLQVTRAAFPIPAAPDLTHRIIAAIPTNRPATDADMLLAELRLVRAEMQAMRSEIDELRRQLVSVRGGLAGQPPPWPVSRLAFPYAAPPDIRRREA